MSDYGQEKQNEIAFFGTTNFRNQDIKFGIKTDDRRRHVYILGKTGMGKTTLLENMVIQDIEAGRGVCYIDPHGDTAEKIINHIPADRINDVLYINPADLDFPVGFNVFESVDKTKDHLLAAGLMGVFKKIWPDVWSPRMEYILQNCIYALLEVPNSTLLGISRILADKVYRDEVVSQLKDPIVRGFWEDEFANYTEKFASEAIAPIQNKVGQFLSAPIIRNIVSQVKSTFNLRDMMDEGKIVVVNLSKGRIGEENSRLLGGLLITKIQLAVMERIEIPEEQRRDFYLYVDEFQNFATESFANILSEARKFHLNLTITHQYIAQLEIGGSTVLRDAVFGNVGTIITLRVGALDAEFLEKEFEPHFMKNDLVTLAKHQMYLRLMIDGAASHPFSATTLPPISKPTGSSEKVVKVSRERFSTPKTVIEDKIIRWRAALHDSTVAARKFQSDRKEFTKKPPIIAKCDDCGKTFSPPFRPVEGKPVFCDDCFPKHRDGIVAKTQARKSMESQPPSRMQGTPSLLVGDDTPGISLNDALHQKPRPTK